MVAQPGVETFGRCLPRKSGKFCTLFRTNLLDAGVTPYLVAPIVGHEDELITGKVYWNVKDATKRKPTVDAFILPVEVLAMLPAVGDVTFVVSGGPKVVQKEGRRTV
jgi:hypothetical protein